MFRRLREPEGPDRVIIVVDGTPVVAAVDDSVAAAVLAAGAVPVRTTPVGGAPRAPYCMMGVCFDCLMEIDGVPNRQACMVPVRDGMQVRRQQGAATVGEGKAG